MEKWFRKGSLSLRDLIIIDSNAQEDLDLDIIEEDLSSETEDEIEFPSALPDADEATRTKF